MASQAERGTAWLALCAVLAGGSLLGFALSNPPALRWSAAGWTSQPWTLWTSSLMHLGMPHLVANLLALGALALLGRTLGAGSPAALAWLLAWPLGTLALLWWPQITSYRGLSGAIHAGVSVLWAWCAMNSVAKPWGFVLFAGLTLKLLTERAWVHPVTYSPDWGFNVVLAAHLAGALCGAALGLLLCGAAALSGRVSGRGADFFHQRRG